MSILDDTRKATADVLRDKIAKMGLPSVGATEKDTELLGKMEEKLNLLNQTGFKSTHDDAYSLRVIHEAFQTMLKQASDSKSIYKHDLVEALIDINEKCINICFNHYLATNANTKSELGDILHNIIPVFQTIPNMTNTELDKNLNSMRDEMTNVIGNLDEKIDVVALQKKMFDLKDKMGNNELLTGCVAALDQLDKKISEVLKVATAKQHTKIQRLMRLPLLLPEPSSPSEMGLFTDKDKLKGKGKGKGKEKMMDVDVIQQKPYRVAVTGTAGSGKTTLVRRLGGAGFAEQPVPMSEESLAEVKVNIADRKVIVVDVDDRCKDHAKTLLLSDANAIVMLIDLTDQRSFNTIKKWLVEADGRYEGNKQIMVIGTKSDLKSARAVLAEEVKDFVNPFSNVSYTEVSIKSNANVKESFIALVDTLKKENEKDLAPRTAFSETPRR